VKFSQQPANMVVTNRVLTPAKDLTHDEVRKNCEA
jgi:hypothetical protein